MNFDLNTLNNIRSFKGRLQYCRQNLTSLGRGSSRIAFLLPNDHVLKLAWNRKGLEQNQYEGGDYYKNDLPCFAHVYNSAEDYTWIESEYAVKCNNSDFIRIFGFDFDTMIDIIVLIVRQRGRGDEYRFHRFKNPEESKRLFEEGSCDCDSFIYDLSEYIGNYGLGEKSCSDFFNIKNWGLVNRDGKDTIVIVDSGLSDEIYDEYYAHN